MATSLALPPAAASSDDFLAMLPDPLSEVDFAVQLAGATLAISIKHATLGDTSSPFIVRVAVKEAEREAFRFEVQCTTKTHEVAELLQGCLTPCDLSGPAPFLDGASAEPVQFTVLKAARQWHNNACGHHALSNALSMLQGRHDLQSEGFQVWSRAAFALRVLLEHSAKSGMWKTSRLESGVLDAAHLNHALSEMGSLASHVTVLGGVDNLETLCRPILERSVKERRRHAFILGLDSHWVAFALVGPKQLWWADAHNKDVLRLESFDDCLARAIEAIENYRPLFRAKIRKLLPRYAHAPEAVLDSLFDDGIPEWWRGEEKPALWWTHRPSNLRVTILQRELELAFLASRWLLKFIRGSPPDILPSSGSRAMQIRASCARNVQSEITHLGSLNGMLRRDEDLVPGDPEYDPNARPSLMSRKRPPHPERLDDPFDRQRVIPGFDQTLVEAQVCLVLGTGGLGQNVALALARLGVGEVILVDYDDYQTSNLTRQCLGTVQDVGKRKVLVAAKQIEHHNIRTKVTALDVDVLSHWDVIVDQAKRSTVFFNCCDAGLMLDFAVASLCKELELPLAQGQSFGWKFLSEFFSPLASCCCEFCFESTQSTFGAHPNLAKQAFSRLQAKFPTQEAADSMRLFTPVQLFEFLSSDDSFQVQEPLEISSPPVSDATSLWAFLKAYEAAVVSLVLPGLVSKQSHLRFIPRPKPPPTRFIGSFVGPCLACSVFMVSQWANFLTGPTSRDPPTTVLFNLDEGMTSEEQMGYEVPLDRASRSFVSSPSNPACVICTSAQALLERRELYFGSQQVWLKPVAGGHTVAMPEFSESVLTTAVYRDSPLLTFPAVPALVPCYDAMTTTPTLSGTLHLPMVKTTQEDAAKWPASVRGMASGQRSAIVHERGTCIRIKGCGNGLEGFPVQGEPPSVRGCVFEDTAARELYMTKLVDDILLGEGRQCGSGNVPLGFWRYPDVLADPKEATLSWTAGVDKLSVVMRTLGDRRLGAHLLAGLVKLATECSTPTPAELARFAQVWDRDTKVTTAVAVECGMSILDWIPVCLHQEDLRPLLMLAWRLGREAGQILDALHRNGVCWGTYADAFGMHCNAHANNLIVVANANSEVLLAPVDFDMAFTRLQFRPELVLPTVAGNALFPARDFDGLLEFEALMGMRPTLAGSDFASTGVSGIDLTGDDVRVLALLDTCVAGFDSALVAEDAHALAAPSDMVAHRSLVEQALRETRNVIV